MAITLIACIDMDNGIGDADGNLLFDLPKDMERFKEETSGKIVVMGRKTWDSLPRKPLAKRKNYIITNDKKFKTKTNVAKIINDIEDVVTLGKTHDVYVIGGGEIYEQLLPYADKMILTHVHVVDKKARTFFPNYEFREWAIADMEKHEADDKHAHDFTIATYLRK